MPTAAHYRPDPRWPSLGAGFHDAVEAATFPQRTPRLFDEAWAARIGLGSLTPGEREAHLARFEPLPGNLERPLALRYHGHQFQTYNPALGDGRGFLYAQLRDPVDGRLLDLGTKGSGPTPYSRRGDGRLTLKGGVREALAAALLEARGVDTCKILSLYETHESLMRYDEPSPTRSCVMVRLNHSHLRFGTFQRHAWENSPARLTALVEYAAEHLLPEIRGAADLPVALLEAAGARAAETCAAWLVGGFVHGVLNTDNMNVTGESFDYGPYRFLPTFDPAFTAAYFDHSRLYAFGRQPDAVIWNVARLADALVQIAPRASLQAVVEGWSRRFHQALERRFCERLGVEPKGEADRALLNAAFQGMRAVPVPYERLFFDWYGGPLSRARALDGPEGRAWREPAFDDLRRLIDGYIPSAPERLESDYFQGEHPEDLIIEELEAIWAQIDERDDWSALEAKLARIRAAGRALGNALAPAGAPPGDGQSA